MYYVPLLVRNISACYGFDVKLRHAELTIHGPTMSTHKYVVNEYNGHIIDIGLFALRHHFESLDELRDLNLCKFPETFIYDTAELDQHFNNIEFKLKKNVSNTRLKEFQPSQLSKNDNMILAAYNYCFAGYHLEKIKKYDYRSKTNTSYSYMCWHIE